jgi:hypothetical protein
MTFRIKRRSANHQTAKFEVTKFVVVVERFHNNRSQTAIRTRRAPVPLSQACPIMVTDLTPWYRIFFEQSLVTQFVKEEPTFFMEPEGSLPWSQNLAIGPYPEPAESSSLHRS